MQVIVKGTLIDYKQAGRGPDIVQIHGWGDSKETFDKLNESLSKSFRLTSLDLPNFGHSGKNNNLNSVPTLAEFLHEFLYKLNISKPVIVGHSMGGQISIYAVAEQVIDAEALIILGGAGVRNTKTIQKRVLKVGAKSLKYIVPGKVKKQLYNVIGSDYNPDMQHSSKIILQNVLNFDVRELAEKITVRTMLVYGQKDVDTPPSYGQIFNAKIVNSQLIIIDDADHWLHQKHSDRVANIIKDFINAPV